MRSRAQHAPRRFRPAAEALDRRQLLAAAVPLGMNIGVPEFVDAIKDTNGWSGVPVDARGWPTAVCLIVVFDDRVNMPWDGPDPNAAVPQVSGDYHLEFTGRANLWAYGADVQNQAYDPTTNTTTADVVVPPGVLFLQLFFSNTQRTPSDPVGSGVSDVHLIRPGYDPNTTQLFTNQYLAALEPFAALRTMDATGTNNFGPERLGQPLNWSQRHLPTDSGVGPGGDGRVAGASWEDLIQLANQTHTDLWINIPGPATDDYIKGLANLLKNGDTVDGVFYPGLASGLKVYVEWSNEVWGGIDTTYNYAVGDVQHNLPILTNDGNPGTDTWRTGPTILRDDLLHTVHIAQDFNTVFHDPNHVTIRPVLSWQEGNTWAFPATFAWFQSNFGAPSQYLYGLGPTYYSPTDYSSVDNLLASLRAAEQANNQGIRDTTALDARYGLVNVSYEGGPHRRHRNAGQVAWRPSVTPAWRRSSPRPTTTGTPTAAAWRCSTERPHGIWGPQWPWDAAELGQASNPKASPKYAGLMDVLDSNQPTS